VGEVGHAEPLDQAEGHGRGGEDGAHAGSDDGDLQRQAAAALRQQLAPFKKQAEKLEKDLGKVHEQLAEVE
ncbi:hypothetical protein R0G64_32500, partial [Pseudomonas otitidis]